MGALHRLDRLTFIATKSIRADAAPDWEAWLGAHSIAHGGALWRLLDAAPPGRPGAGHSHVIHLPTDRGDDFDRASTAARADGRAAAHAEIRRDGWTRAGDGIVLDGGAAITGLIVAEVMCADPTRIDEWDEWYDTQHLPDVMDSGAFVAGSRWRRAEPRPGSANHLTVYEVSGGDVAEAIERSAAVMPGLTASGRKHECHAGGLTWALELAP